MDILSGWIEPAARKYGEIIVITGTDWDTDLSPWPAPGVPRGSEDFRGGAAEFLSRLRSHVMPQLEHAIGISADAKRTLVGVSMSGLFTLWQWILCDTFANIACLSGSFWYDCFAQWVLNSQLPAKSGKAYFLLGNKEAKARVKVFQSVETDTRDIVAYLQAAGIKATLQMVPGNHYSSPIPRLNTALAALFDSSI